MESSAARHTNSTQVERETVKETVKQKLQLQQQSISGRKVRKSCSKISKYRKSLINKQNTEIKRRQSYPPSPAAASTPTSAKLAPSTSHSVSRSRRMSDPIVRKAHREGIQNGFFNDFKGQNQKTAQSAILLCEAPRIPVRALPRGRKSSFLRRKKQDNQLGYRGRCNHRHPHQSRREKEFNAYKNGTKPPCDDDDYHSD